MARHPIGQVAKQSGVAVETVRFYEREGRSIGVELFANRNDDASPQDRGERHRAGRGAVGRRRWRRSLQAPKSTWRRNRFRPSWPKKVIPR